MTAAAAHKDSEGASGRGGLRPVDARRDMAAVADLIERSFNRELDGKSRRMVREMRTFGRAGWLGWLVGHFFLPPAAYPRGFVWEEGDQVVGNASLLPAFPASARWVLANVAVHPDQRRRGIARRLVEACVGLAESEGAREVLLQVRSANEGALGLYRALGFRVLTERTHWVRRPRQGPSMSGGATVRPRRRDEWVWQWRTAQNLFPEGLYWPYPLSRLWFEPAGWERFLSLRQNRHWVVPDEEGSLRASLSARYSRDAHGWRLALLVPRHERGEVEASLLARGVDDLRRSGLSLSLSYPPGEADDDLKRLGFRRRRTLAWMGKGLEGSRLGN